MTIAVMVWMLIELDAPWYIILFGVGAAAEVFVLWAVVLLFKELIETDE